MYWQTLTWTWANAIVAGMLDALSTRPAAALLTTPKVRLYSNDALPAPDDVLSNFTASAFSGYADVALTLTGVVNFGANVRAMIGHADFMMDSGTLTPVPGVANGYVVTDGSAAYYGGEKFNATVNFAIDGDFLAVDVVLPLPNQQDVPSLE